MGDPAPVGRLRRERFVHVHGIEVVRSLREMADPLFGHGHALFGGHADSKFIQDVAAGRMGFDHPMAVTVRAGFPPAEKRIRPVHQPSDGRGGA